MSEPLSSPRNPRIAAVRKLLAPRGRAAASAFVVEGPHAVAEALTSPWHAVRELFVTTDAARREVELLRTAAAGEVAVTLVTDHVLSTLADTVTPQGVLAVVTRTAQRLDDLLPAAPRFAVVLADVADPGNAGTVIRTADAAGADVVLLTGSSVDPHNPKCVRASVGSLFHLPVVRHADTLQALDALHARGATVLATTVDADRELDDVVDEVGDNPVAWLFGNEAHGLPADVVAHADRRVRIPIYGRAESLNLAAAAAVCLYSTARRRAR